MDAERQRAGRDPAAYYAQVGRFMAGLPVDRFPTTTALTGEPTAGDGDERFALGLDLLVRGLAAQADAARAAAT